MGGEIWATFVYGFEVKEEYVKLRGGGKNVYIGSKSKYGFPIYFCIDLHNLCKKELNINEIQNTISNLDQTSLDKMAEFDLFAAKYGYTPSWQVCCVGDFEIKLASDSGESVIQRLYEYRNYIAKQLKEQNLSNEDDFIKTNYDDFFESIEIILLEENMGFIIKDAIETKNIDDIISMVKDYYSMK